MSDGIVMESEMSEDRRLRWLRWLRDQPSGPGEEIADYIEQTGKDVTIARLAREIFGPMANTFADDVRGAEQTAAAVARSRAK